MWASPIAAFCSELRECGQCGPFAVLMGQHRKKKEGRPCLSTLDLTGIMTYTIIIL